MTEYPHVAGKLDVATLALCSVKEEEMAMLNATRKMIQELIKRRRDLGITTGRLAITMDIAPNFIK